MRVPYCIFTVPCSAGSGLLFESNLKVKVICKDSGMSMFIDMLGLMLSAFLVISQWTISIYVIELFTDLTSLTTMELWKHCRTQCQTYNSSTNAGTNKEYEFCCLVYADRFPITPTLGGYDIKSYTCY